MNLNDLLRGKGVDPATVLVMRHRPTEPELNNMLPWIVAEHPKIFNAYQQTQTEKVERAMKRASYVCSFIGKEPGKALFVGLYSIRSSKPLKRSEVWTVPEHRQLKKYGWKGFGPQDHRSQVLWFDLVKTDFYEHWTGKLIVNWPPPERSWWRWSQRNNLDVFAVLEEDDLVNAMPEWNELVLTWKELSTLPTRWKTAISQWRGIYYICDTSDDKGYVGSACGHQNILGRWTNYAASGHGGNTLLRRRNPDRFQFSILELASPASEPDEVICLENKWKKRLNTRVPHGLNNN